MTKKGKRTALLQRTEQVAGLQRENEELRARLAAPEKTDEKLRQSEERYRLLADNASDVIWIADVDLNMTYVSPSAARMLGCGMNELMTPAVSDVLLPESVRLRIKDFADQVASESRHPGRSARELTLETGLQLRDGSTIWVEHRIDFIRDEVDRLTGVMGITRDVTDRRMAEEELRASEARNRLLIENANEGILVVQDEVVKFANPKLAEISGYSMQGLVSKPLLDLFHQDDRQTVQGYYARRIKGEELPHVYPARLLDRAGRTKWVEINAVMLDWEGHPAVLALVTDLTERRAAQQALEESERKYRALAEESIQGLVVAQGLPPRFVYCNAAMAGMTGYTVEELVSMSPEQFAALIHPEDREMVFKRFTEPPAGAATEEHLHFRGLRRDGREVWLEMAATSVEYQGAPAVQAALIDITERKMAEEALRANEEKFRQITENMLDAVSLVDKDGIIRYVSPSHEGILGYKPEDLVGTSVFDPIFPEDRDGVMAALDEILKKREGRFQYRFRHSDGHYVWGEASARIMVDDDGNMSGAVIASRDIADRKKAEEALKDSEAKYKRLFESTQTAMEVISMETGLVVLANEAMAKLFGVASADDLVGIDSVQYLRPEDVGRVSAKMAQAVADSSWREIEELQVRRADGRWIWISGMVTQSEYQGKPSLLVSLLDITSRKQAEEALKESEAKYRNLFEHTLLGMEVIDGQTGKTVLANRSVARMFGFKSPADMVGTNPLEYVLPEDLDWVVSQIAQLTAEPSWDKQATIRARTEDGRIIWLTGMTTPFEYEGKPGMLISLVDATAAKEAELKLQESEERYRLLAQNASDIIWVIGSELKITYVSPSATTLLGYSAEELVTGAFDKLLPPSSLATITRLYEDGLAEEESAPGSMTTTTVEVQVSRKDGSTLWLEAAVNTIRDSEGRFAGFQGACRDITGRKRAEEDLRRAHAELEERVEQRTAELKQANTLLMQEIRQRRQAQGKLQESESRYRELVESANSIILELDTKGKVTFFNRFAQEFFGFSESDILGRPAVGTIAPPMDSEGKDLRSQARDLIKHPEDYLVIENEGVRRSGERVWISWTNKGIYDAKGKLRNVLCIGMDRTEQRRVAEMLERQLKERVATEERQRLARDLHDAVTQTLFSASLIAEVLPRLWKRDRAEGERRLEELRRLTRGALAEMRMLLLELRPGALGEVGLANLLHQLVEATAAQTKVQVDLALRGECDAPAEVQVALYRVAQEALNNVVKHSGAEEAKIRLACEGGSADLTVSDNGSGFDAKSVSPESLGLRIMQERAEAVGATVKVEGRVGRGTRVRARWSGAKRKGDS